MNNEDLFMLLKLKKIHIDDIDNPTDEMLWWAIHNNYTVRNHKLSKEMICDILSKGQSNLDLKQLENMEIPEHVWIDYINNVEFNFFMFNNILKHIISPEIITENIAMALCLKHPLFYTDNTIKNLVPDSRKHEISTVFFDGLKNKIDWHCELPKELPISLEQWQWIAESQYLKLCSGRIKTYIQIRDDAPDFVRHNILKNTNHLDEWGPITADDLLVWIDAHKDELDSNSSCQDSVKYHIHCSDMAAVLSKNGWFIKYLKNQSNKNCMAAIKCDPSNIQHIRKPSKIMIDYALSLDSSVSKYIKTESEIQNQYPADNYLVKLHEDLCDEDYLTKICIIKGKDMPKFMNKTTSLSFGNLYDDTKHNVKDIASYQPITDDELKIIRKFGLDDIQSGYFSNLD